MSSKIQNLNERVKSLTLSQLAIGAIVALILTIIFEIIFRMANIKTVDFSILFALFLVFVFLLKGVKDFKSDIHEIFIEENRNEVFYLIVINLLFGFFALSFFGSFDPTFARGLVSSETVGISFILEIISSIILAPVAEELLFRGIIFNKLNIKMNFVYAMIISSLLFSLFHGFGRLLTTFLCGLILCVIYLKTDNILIPIFIHISNNLIATILTDFWHIEPIVASPPVSYIMLLISVIAGILMIMYVYKNVKVLKPIKAS